MEFPIRILHVLGALNRGGAETMIMNLYRKIDRSIVQFDFVIHTTDECDYNEEINELGGKIFSIQQYRGVNHLEYRRLWEKIFRDYTEYDIIHAHARSTASIYLKIAKRYGLTTIIHSHSTSSGKGIQAIVKDILQLQIRFIADSFIACSYEAGRWLFGKHVCDSDEFIVLKNAIDVKEFIFNKRKRIQIREEFNLKGKFIIGHVGRFDYPKNHNYIIEVFNVLETINNDAVLVLVGDGMLRKDIEAKVIKLGLESKVFFLGKREDIGDLLQAMDVFICPSFYEGLGIVAIEAQAAGLPCIVSDRFPQKETQLTELIHYLPIEIAPVKWALEINKNNYINRIDRFSEIEKSGYDIYSTVTEIENMYMRLIEKHKGD